MWSNEESASNLLSTRVANRPWKGLIRMELFFCHCCSGRIGLNFLQRAYRLSRKICLTYRMKMCKDLLRRLRAPFIAYITWNFLSRKYLIQPTVNIFFPDFFWVQRHRMGIMLRWDSSKSQSFDVSKANFIPRFMGSASASDHCNHCFFFLYFRWFKAVESDAILQK